jgi:hypothetical protein
LEAITTLISSGAFESEIFDFKERLPHSQDNVGKERLRSACAAFANAEGGFLVFGIADDRALAPDARLVGVDGDGDFPVRFGEFATSCSPSVAWQFRNPAIALPNRRVLHVVHLPKSTNAPHAVGSTESGWKFPKRTNRGTESMSIQEIRSSFLGLYEKRLKLQLLGSELRSLRQSASGAAITDAERIETEVSLASFDLQVLESVLADTYSITAGLQDFHRKLSQIRQNARLCNVKMQLIWGVVHMPLSHRKQLIREHNTSIRTIAEGLKHLCEGAVADLDAFLAR